MSMISRRLFGCAGLAAAASLTACAETFPIGDNEGNSRSANRSGGTLSHPDYRGYGSYRGEQFPIPAVDYHAINQTFLRQEVTYLFLRSLEQLWSLRPLTFCTSSSQTGEPHATGWVLDGKASTGLGRR